MWCAQQSGIPENLAEPSVAIAGTAAEALDKQDAEELADPTDTTPFRHQCAVTGRAQRQCAAGPDTCYCA